MCFGVETNRVIEGGSAALSELSLYEQKPPGDVK
jgi:hypothetical protein